MRSQGLSETRREIIEILRKFAREINATIYLFGSYARGDHTLESDVDIVVVCSCFENMKYIDRIEFVRTKLPYNIGFDIIALTPEEFEHRLQYALYRDISRYRIEIKP